MGGRRCPTAVITGGASGIGRACAERLAADGVQLVLADIEEPALDETVARLAAGGAEVLGCTADVSSLASVERLRDAALRRFGSVDIVMNNAGVGGGSAISSSPEVSRWVMDVNLGGVVNGIAVFLPLLLEQDAGHLINTASVAGLGGVPGMGRYSASKAAVIGLSEALFHELAALGSSVRTSVLCPGFVRTRIHESARNAPTTVGAAWSGSAALEATGGIAREAVEGGIDAAVVADAVADALVDGRFWVHTHERLALGTVRQRLHWMQDGTVPRFDLSKAGQGGQERP
jgi:NAD(P)-dependent dehydrogenase (short-subunit alcohol dehydrogenase family)